ncbi:hypothetical protein [Nocardioides sp. SYSU D00038]|uniref:hypothetical protein n=1 Tax=Nocardioides sp. SYSU D00038 TaxID=2812554 RepID=UPI001966EE3F|nr:hypothetical protein [Nocardioides sp. SYSU D00038]
MTSIDPTTSPGLGRRLLDAPAAVATGARTLLVEIFVEPVRDGRLRTEGWPRGLRPVVLLALLGFVAAGALVVLAPLLRERVSLTLATGGQLVYPDPVLPVFLLLVVLTLSLLHTASLHLAPWLRVLVLVVVVISIVAVVPVGVSDALAAHVVTWVAGGALVALTAARWGRPFRWWEFVVSFTTIGVAVGLGLRLLGAETQALGFDASTIATIQLLGSVAVLAVPFTFVGGVAFAQLAMVMARRVGDAVDQRVRGRLPVGVVVLVVAAVDLVLVWRHLREPTSSGWSQATELAGAGVLLVVAALVGWWILTPSVGAPDLDGLEGAVSRLGLPVAVALTFVAVLGTYLGSLDLVLSRWGLTDSLPLSSMGEFLVESATLTTSRVLAAVGLLVWAARQRRRQPLLAVLAATLAVTVLVVFTRRVTQGLVVLPVRPEALTTVTVAAVVALLVGLGATGRLTRRRLVDLGLVLGIALAFAVRTEFDAPFVALLGLGGAAAVFVGLVWATLTDADDANEDSQRYPRPARVLLFSANALLAMTALAWTAVTRSTRDNVDVSAYATLGDDLLGTALMLTAYVVLVRGLFVSPAPAPSPAPSPVSSPAPSPPPAPPA